MNKFVPYQTLKLIICKNFVAIPVQSHLVQDEEIKDFGNHKVSACSHSLNVEISTSCSNV